MAVSILLKIDLPFKDLTYISHKFLEPARTILQTGLWVVCENEDRTSVHVRVCVCVCVGVCVWVGVIANVSGKQTTGAWKGT